MRNLIPMILILALAPLPAHAMSLGFQNITANNVGDAAIGDSHLSVEVSEYGTNQALCQFYNVGTDACSITDVYFDDGTLLGIALILDSDSGVSFSTLANPGNLPGGNEASPPFVTTAGFSADSDPKVQPNGVNPGETLGIVFDMQSGRVYSDVLTDLATGDLRIGVHVQGFDSGGSESFVNNIPDASTLLLLGSASLIGLAGLRRRV